MNLNEGYQIALQLIQELEESGDTELNVSNLGLTQLPPLPANLTELECDDNNLTSLPELPTTLRILHCNNNQLVSLPKLPNGLKEIWCRNNRLTTLGRLPKSLINVYPLPIDFENNPFNEPFATFVRTLDESDYRFTDVQKFINKVNNYLDKIRKRKIATHKLKFLMNPKSQGQMKSMGEAALYNLAERGNLIPYLSGVQGMNTTEGLHRGKIVHSMVNNAISKMPGGKRTRKSKKTRKH